MTCLDREKLRAFLAEREAAQNDLVWAIYKGLRDRVDRGDFDAEEER